MAPQREKRTPLVLTIFSSVQLNMRFASLDDLSVSKIMRGYNYFDINLMLIEHSLHCVIIYRLESAIDLNRPQYSESGITKLTKKIWAEVWGEKEKRKKIRPRARKTPAHLLLPAPCPRSFQLMPLIPLSLLVIVSFNLLLMILVIITYR